MLSEAFLESFADFYGSFTLDELAELFGVTTATLASEFDYLIDRNLDIIEEEMGMEEDQEDED